MKKLFAIAIILIMVLGIFPGCTLIMENQIEDTKPAVEMPKLPDLDFENLDFFEDGYQIVEYRSLSDGDTATFVLNGMPTSTRFLAIDTPETNSSTDGLQPWALAAKAYTQNKLENAEIIILENDDESDVFDNYDRLLAWIWVDGELLNYQLVEEGLAYVKYLYGDYKYNSTMIALESSVQKQKIKIWGEDDPDFDYEKETVEATIAEARAAVPGSDVIITGIITATIDKNAFIQDETGAIYIYANKYNYSALEVGNKVTLEAKVLDYNGLLELSSIKDKKITLLSEGHNIEPMEIELADIGEEIESMYVSLSGLKVERVDIPQEGSGYTIIVSQNNITSAIRIDKYLEDYPDPNSIHEGMIINVVGNVSQFMENYQIMISGSDSITYE